MSFAFATAVLALILFVKPVSWIRALQSICCAAPCPLSPSLPLRMQCDVRQRGEVPTAPTETYVLDALTPVWRRYHSKGAWTTHFSVNLLTDLRIATGFKAIRLSRLPPTSTVEMLRGPSRFVPKAERARVSLERLYAPRASCCGCIEWRSHDADATDALRTNVLGHPRYADSSIRRRYAECDAEYKLTHKGLFVDPADIVLYGGLGSELVFHLRADAADALLASNATQNGLESSCFTLRVEVVVPAYLNARFVLL